MTKTPDLEPLDVHGVDDAGVYHPPSLRRYREMMDIRDALEARVTGLQGDNTRIENERRKFKALYEATRSLLLHSFVDAPIYHRLMGADQMRARMDLTREIEKVRTQSETLINDAWCGAANEARAFVKEAKVLSCTCTDDRTFIERWTERFQALL